MLQTDVDALEAILRAEKLSDESRDLDSPSRRLVTNRTLQQSDRRTWQPPLHAWLLGINRRLFPEPPSPPAAVAVAGGLSDNWFSQVRALLELEESYRGEVSAFALAVSFSVFATTPTC